MIDALLINAPGGRWRNVHAEIRLKSFFWAAGWGHALQFPSALNASACAEGFTLKPHHGYTSEGRLAVFTGSQVREGESFR